MATEKTPIHFASSLDSDSLQFQNIPHGQADRGPKYTIDDDANEPLNSSSLSSSSITHPISSNSSSSSNAASSAADASLRSIAISLAASHFFPQNNNSSSSSSTGGGSGNGGHGGGGGGFQPFSVENDRSSEQQQQSSQSPPSFYQLAYYRRAFDISTEDILDRLRRSLFPFTPKPFYGEQSHKPDMYGPFWITTTLIIIVAITANLDDYFKFITEHNNNSITPTPTPSPANGTQTTPPPSTTAAPSSSVSDIKWEYDFEKVTVASGVLYGYLFLWSLVVYCVLNRLSVKNRLVYTMSIIGYSLIVYLPICPLMLIPINFLRWSLVGAAYLFSSFFLVRNLSHSHASTEERSLQGNDSISDFVTPESESIQQFQKKALPMLVAILLANAVIAGVLKWYFFVSS